MEFALVGFWLLTATKLHNTRRAQISEKSTLQTVFFVVCYNVPHDVGEDTRGNFIKTLIYGFLVYLPVFCCRLALFLDCYLLLMNFT